MPSTSRLGWIYPVQDQKDWWTIWETMINQQDADVWASFENSFIVLSGEGSIYLDTVTDTLVWTEDLYLYNALSGGSVRILASSITLEEGSTAYVSITRPLASNYDATMAVSTTPLTGQDERNNVFVAMRIGDKLVTRPWQSNPPVRVFDDTITTTSLVSAAWTREVDIKGIQSGKVLIVELDINGAGISDDTEITIYDDDPSGAGVAIYQAIALDIPTDGKHSDPNIWWTEVAVEGSIWVKVENKTANATIYDFRLRIEGDAGTVFTE